MPKKKQVSAEDLKKAAEAAEALKKEEKKKLSQTEFETKVLELSKQNITAEKIGLKLKQEKIHSKDYEKSISQILIEKDLYVQPDLKNVEVKLEKIRSHFGKNKQDKRAKRELVRVQSQLRKLKIYHNVL